MRWRAAAGWRACRSGRWAAGPSGRSRAPVARRAWLGLVIGFRSFPRRRRADWPDAASAQSAHLNGHLGQRLSQGVHRRRQLAALSVVDGGVLDVAGVVVARGWPCTWPAAWSTLASRWRIWDSRPESFLLQVRLQQADDLHGTVHVGLEDREVGVGVAFLLTGDLAGGGLVDRGRWRRWPSPAGCTAPSRTSVSSCCSFVTSPAHSSGAPARVLSSHSSCSSLWNPVNWDATVTGFSHRPSMSVSRLPQTSATGSIRS